VIELSYSTNGLVNLSLMDAIDAVEKAGYPGIELAFHMDQFNPFEMSEEKLLALRQRFESSNIKPSCIATPTLFFLADRPHDPSAMCVDLAGRKQRIKLIKEGIKLARALDVKIVSFGSGFIRDDHVNNPHIDPEALLIDSVRECVEFIGDDDIILTIEPEPGMFIETIAQGVALIEKVNLDKFRLHIDICHAYCSDEDYVNAIGKAAHLTKYLHVSDTTEGYNLKILQMADKLDLDFNFASYLIYFPDTADFLLLDNDRAAYFYDQTPDKIKVDAIAKELNGAVDVVYVPYDQLPQESSSFDDEIFTYVLSVPKLSFYVLDRAKPIIHYLRQADRRDQGLPYMDKMVANSLTGKVHFHIIPGDGEIDFVGCFKAAVDNGFSGYATVELYHHIDSWEEAVSRSYNRLSECL
jgi:sugar phosphate isomerase/epimerase